MQYQGNSNNFTQLKEEVSSLSCFIHSPTYIHTYIHTHIHTHIHTYTYFLQVKEMTATLRKHNFSFGDEKVLYQSDYASGKYIHTYIYTLMHTFIHTYIHNIQMKKI